MLSKIVVAVGKMNEQKPTLVNLVEKWRKVYCR